MMKLGPMTCRIAPALGLGLAAALLLHAWEPARGHQGRGQLMHEHASAQPADNDYAPPPPETLGGAFELVDHTGKTVSDATFRGKWMLIFFGFAGCREACPVGLDRITQSLDELGDAGRNIQPLFVDLDFAGPDLTGLAQFVGHFHPRLIGLTGSRRQMYSILRSFQVRREIKHSAVGKKETGPRIDHSTYFFMVDPAGRTRTYFHHSLTPAEMTAHIRRHL